MLLKNNIGMEAPSFIISVIRLTKCNFPTQNILTKPMSFSISCWPKLKICWERKCGTYTKPILLPAGTFPNLTCKNAESTAPRLEGFSGFPKRHWTLTCHVGIAIRLTWSKCSVIAVNANSARFILHRAMSMTTNGAANRPLKAEQKYWESMSLRRVQEAVESFSKTQVRHPWQD